MEALIDLAHRAESVSIREWLTFRGWSTPEYIDWDNFLSYPASFLNSQSR